MSPELPKPARLSWNEFGQHLRNLADQPMILVLVLLAANAVTRPYANIDHDARLYSVQVLNQAEHGSYNDDLFFRYGSQAQFSLFSLLLAPLVNLLGVKLTFFLVYLAGDVLFIAALVRLVRRLIEDRLLAFLSLLYLVVAPLNYGGQNILHVHEPFLTPRLLAVGLVLLGLEQLLQGRRWSSLLLMVLAGSLHPLMAMGGFLTWGGVCLVDRLGPRRAALVAGGLMGAGVATLAVPSLAGRFLGHLDEAWRSVVLHASSFIFPSEWMLGDWINVLVCLVAMAAGVYLYRKQDPCRAHFFAVVFLVGIAAVVGTILGAELPYALLLNGQPYRALWILKALQVPLCFLLADRLWLSGKLKHQILALALLGWLVLTSPLLLEWLLPLLFLPVALVYFRGVDGQPRRPDWILVGVVASVVLGQLTWTLYKEVLCLTHWQELLACQDLFDWIHILIGNVGILPGMVLALALVFCLFRGGARQRTVGLTCLAVFATVSLGFFLLPNTAYVRQHGTRDLPDILYARAFLRDQQPRPGKLLTIYSAYGKVDYVWLELRANNYFDWWPAGGFMFHRETAMEGQRRALVAGPFEVEHLREVRPFLDDRVKRDLKRFFGCDLDDPAPTVADLARLCREEDLDFALLRQEFPGLYSASNGRVFIYDCRHVRAALKLAPPETAVTRVTQGNDVGQRCD